MMETSIKTDLARLAPEIFLALSILMLLVFGAWRKGKADGGVYTLAIAALAGVALLAGFYPPAGGGEAFQGAIFVDSFAIYAKIAVFLSAAAALVLSRDYLRRERLDRFEYPVLVLLAVLGMSVMVTAHDLLTLYMGVELQSLALYVLAAFNRKSERASEAGLKYFVLGALSSGLLLYGLSLMYGFTGATGFAALGDALRVEAPVGALIGLVFVLSGLAFKISAAPFHMWTPDVYEGAPTPVTAFFTAAPKFAAMALITRLLMGPFGAVPDAWRQIVIVLAVASMLIGAFGALTQSNIKRLMAYSSITNMGYALVALSAGTKEGVMGLLAFMTVYLVTVLGVFSLILAMRRKDGMVENIDDLAGLSRTHPGLCLALTLFLFSMAGLPPLAGFFGKIFAFLPAVKAGLWPLVLLAMIASVVSAFYYLRIIKVMWFDKSAPAFVTPALSLRFGVLTASLFVALFFLWPPLVGMARSWVMAASGALF